MVIGAEKHQVGSWSSQALERLALDGLDATPQNYSVAYYYCSGGRPSLTTAYEGLASEGKITQAHYLDLYQRYVMGDGELAFLKEANHAVEREVKKVMDLLALSTQGADKFGENLTQFSGQIGAAGSIEALRGAVKKIADETSMITRQNEKLQSELADTTGQLSEMRSNFERAHKESQIDALTEVGNRKFFDREIVKAMIEARNNNTVLSILMVDIDHFKKFNDTHGHLIGDKVLRLVARTMIENLKGRDVIARFGGEEFAILLPHTKVQDAERVANQLRASLATKQITKRGSNEVLGTITISIGAAEYIKNEERDQFIARADVALYKAKEGGRNKVVCSGA